MNQTTAVPSSARTRRPPTLSERGPALRIVLWVDPVADPHGVRPCSRYVELYWLGVIGPPTMKLEPVHRSRCRPLPTCRRAGTDTDPDERPTCWRTHRGTSASPRCNLPSDPASLLFGLRNRQLPGSTSD